MKRWTFLLLLAACATDQREIDYGFTPIEVGADDRGRAPRPKSNEQLVRAYYADVLGRSPETYELTISASGKELARLPLDEQALLTAALDGISDPAPLRSVLVTALLSSSEVELPTRAEVEDPEAFVREQFRRLLGREPSVYELAELARLLRDDHDVTPAVLIQAILESREYQSN